MFSLLKKRPPSASSTGNRRPPRCGALVAAIVVVVAAGAARADHGEPSASPVAELSSQLGLRLDELAASFGFEPGSSPSFDDSRFNKLLRKARLSLDQARGHVGRHQLCEGLFKLARSVSQLEHAAAYGAAADVSGWGFAEDLASFASFISESLLEDAIVLAAQDGADESSLDLAAEAEASGAALRQAEEWTAAMVEFVAGTCALF